MVLPELRALAKQVGVEGASGMRKSELIAAIRERRGESNGRDRDDANDQRRAERVGARRAPPPRPRPTTRSSAEAADSRQQRRERRGASREAGERPAAGRSRTSKTPAKHQGRRRRRPGQDRQPDTKPDSGDQQQGDQQGNQQGRKTTMTAKAGRAAAAAGSATAGAAANVPAVRAAVATTELREDDVVQPVAGILDVLDNYAFVRTSGYLAGPNDVYVSMNMVRKNGLRRGDAITGAVRVPKDGEQPNQRQKFNPLVRLDTVNGGPVEDAKKRPDFTKLTPLYPNQRLRLETTPDRLTTRVIDLIMPIGKGQRALIVSPPKAGKTTILQDIANAITRNNPECHLMVVLVDERPEEVTDMQRSVKGEVIASTFDRPPSDHTQAAELAIERAKRLVEQGKDVDRAARLDHPAGPRVQQRVAGVGPHPVRWCGLHRAVPAQAVPRRGPQHRGRRLADDHRHGDGRDRLHRRHGDLRGVQGHR